MAKTYSIQVLFEVLNRSTEPLRGIGGQIGQLGASLDRIAEKSKNIGDRMQNIGGKFSTFVTAPILGLGAAALKASGDLEMLKADFTTMFKGNVEQADKFTDALREMGAATPFELMDLAGNAKQLLNMNIAQAEIIPTMRMLGDVASGNAVKLQSLTLAFGRASSQGKLTGETLEIMMNAGFNPLRTIAEKTGKTGKALTAEMGRLRGEVSKGTITFDMISDAFTTATSEGGLFYKGAERGSKTLPGLLSNLRDSFFDLLVTIGDTIKVSLNLSKNIPRISDAILSFSKSIRDWVKENPKLAKFTVQAILALAAFGPLVAIIGRILTLIGPMLTGFRMMGTAFTVMSSGIKFLIPMLLSLGKALISLVIAGGPVLWTIMAIAIAALLIWKYWEPIKKFFIELWAEIYKRWGPEIEMIKALFLDFVDWIVDAWETITKFFKDPFAPLRNAIASIRKYFDDNFFNPIADKFDIFSKSINQLKAKVGFGASAKTTEELDKEAAEQEKKTLGKQGAQEKQQPNKSAFLGSELGKPAFADRMNDQFETAKSLQGSEKNSLSVAIEVTSDKDSSATITNVSSPQGKKFPRVSVVNHQNLGMSRAFAET